MVDVVGFCVVQNIPLVGPLVILACISLLTREHFADVQFFFFFSKQRQRLNSTRQATSLWSKSFFYGESGRSSPLWKNFTPLTKKGAWGDRGGSWACLPVNGYEWIHPAESLWHRYVVALWRQVVFLTVNHRGPLPSRELHSTDEIRVWRDPRRSWACLRPVSDYEWIHPGRGCDTDMWCLCGTGHFSYGEPPRTPPLEGTSLHRRNASVERPWGILSLFTTCFRLRVSSPCQRLWQTGSVSVKQAFFSFLFLFYSTRKKNMSMERLGSGVGLGLGSWACVRPPSPRL